MTIRPFLLSTLREYPALNSIHGGRVYAQGGLLSARVVKPFEVYTLGNNTDEGMSDLDNFRPNRQFFQVFIHDERGDYLRIDDLVELTIKALTEAPRPETIVEIRYLETSQDLDDPVLQTYFRYVRFQAAMSR